MYVEPGTNIKILKNIPLDLTYDHTIYFSSKSAQTSYFMSKVKYNLTDYTYQRVNNGICRVGINSENLYDCNYMMFQNTSFGNKWFYAYIKDIEYKNNEMSIIRFEIDPLQTWFFDFTLNECFVEREHVTDDFANNHLEPEPVELGEYVMNDYAPVTDLTSMCVVIAVVDTDNSSAGNLYDGIYGGAQLYVYDSTDVQTINAKLDEYLQKPDAIIGMYMLPKKLIVEIPSNHLLPYGASGITTNVNLGPVPLNAELDGYIPKNKKLYSYPYNYYHIDNANGESLALRYEFFDGGIVRVEVSGTITQPVQLSLRPNSYKGCGNYDSLGGWKTLNTEILSLSNYPICSWAIDSYQAWIAQNSIPLAMDSVTKLGQIGVGGMLTGNMVGVGMGAVGTVSNILSQTYKASIMADTCKGSVNNGGVNTAVKKQQFYGGRCSITATYAKMIDDFFTMYGYAIHRCKTPNISARPHWNYIKTVGCNIDGSVPCDDMKRICDIFNNGITFWKNGDEIGNYQLDNKIGG